MSTETATKLNNHNPREANPNQILYPATAEPDRLQNSSISITSSPISGTKCSSRKGGEETKGTALGSVAGIGAPASHILKKIARAERFGISVHLSEGEKRHSRAERFGTGSASNGSDTLKETEELKRKARAARFGLSGSSVASSEEANKKARLALEEEKMKARAMRRVPLLARLEELP